MKKILLFILLVVILLACQENLVLDEEKLELSESLYWDVMFDPPRAGWKLKDFYKKFERDVNINDSRYKKLIALDEYSEQSLIKFGDIWFSQAPILSMFAYQVFLANGNEPMSIGFDTALRLDEAEGGTYHTRWGMFFLKAGVGINFISREVFTHELVHAFQHKVCKYTMDNNESDMPFVEAEADMVTDVMGYYPNRNLSGYKSMFFKNVDDPKILEQEKLYLEELTILIETGFVPEKITEFYNKWYKIVRGQDPGYRSRTEALLRILTWCKQF